MLCNNCNIRGICKIFDAVNTPGISIEMKSCSFRSLSGTMPVMQIDKGNMPTINKEAIDEAKDRMQSLLTARKSRAYQDISELSDKLRAEKEAKKNKVNILDIEEGEQVECAQCNTQTSSAFNCPICHKQICLECAMVHISPTGKVMNICEECWTTDADIEQHKNIEESTKEEQDNE